MQGHAPIYSFYSSNQNAPIWRGNADHLY